MARKRTPLSLKNNAADNESQIEEFVLKGSFTNVNGEPAWAESPTTWIELDRILLPNFQLRTYFDRAVIEKIKASIESIGIKQALLVRPHPTQEGYLELIAGSQRRQSAIELNYSPVPVKVDEVDDVTALEIALVENDARSDISPYEETRGTLRLLEMKLNVTTEEIERILWTMFNADNRNQECDNVIDPNSYHLILQTFQRRGLDWKSFITNRLSLLKLPEDIKLVLEKGQIEYTKAKKIGKIKDANTRQEILHKALTENLSGSEIQSLILQSRSTKPKTDVMELRDYIRTTIKRATNPKLLKNPETRTKILDLLNQIEAIASKEN